MADWPTSPPTGPPTGGTGVGTGPPPGLRAGGATYPAGPPSSWPAAPPPGPGWGAPPGPGTPPPGDVGRGGGPGRIVGVVVAVLVVMGLAIVGIGALVSTSDDAEEATDTTIDLSDPEITAPPSEEPLDPNVPSMPSMPSLPELDPNAPDPAERARPLAEVLPELVAFVEETRGQRFATAPVVDAVPDDEFVALLEEARAEEAASLEAAGVTDAALGLIPPGTDLVEIAGAAGAVGVLGFYDPETTELYVKGDVITPFVQAVIVHELTHALDDQIFDLGRLDDLVTRPDESAFGFLALVEGTASFVQDAFVAQLSPEDAAAYETEQLQLGLEQLPSTFDIPPAFLVESQVPYASGQRFVDALFGQGGTAGIDAAYATPPTTSEQVLDPALYASAEPAVELTPIAAPSSVEVAEEGAFGAADLRLLEVVSDPLSALTDPDVGLLDPVDGFGGGQYVSWVEGDRSCISLEAVGDDAAGSAAIADAFETWAASAPGAEVSSRVGGNGLDVVTAFRCA